MALRLTLTAVAPRRLVERCQIILRAAEGETNEQIATALGITRQKAARWRDRFRQGGRAGLEQDAPGRGRKPTYGPEIQQLIVERTLRTTPPGATHWSQRTMARALEVSSRTIGRVWQAHGLIGGELAGKRRDRGCLVDRCRGLG